MAFTNLPPELQAMFNSIYDRLSKLETGPNQAMYTAEFASAQATAAMDEAVQALAQAQGAYSTASQAIIKSSNTIVNASNQLTAINGNGITVYAGSSPISGARVVLNSAGLAGFNSGGTPTFAIDASNGAVSTTGAIFTNSTIYGGSLNINGNAIINSSGFLTATGATITGVITATSGSFTGTVTASSGQIAGWLISGNSLVGTGSSLYGMNGASGSADFGTVSCFGLTSSTFINGATFAASGTITATGSITSNGELYAAFGASNTVSNAANTWMSTSGQLRRVVSSSQRYKEDIVDLVDVTDLHPSKLLDLPVRAFRYKPEFLSGEDDRSSTLMPGFIAEEVADIYPIAADFENGQAESWNDRVIVPALLALIQDQEKRIKALEARL